MIKKLTITFLLTLIALQANALERFYVKGILKQGGLVAIYYNVGNTKSITINGKNIAIEDDGLEYYPIARYDKALNLVFTDKKGEEFKKVYTVEQQKYNVQHIKGVKKEHVSTPNPELMKRISKESAEIIKSREFNSTKMFNTALPEFILPANGVETGVFGSSRTYNGVEKSWHKGVDIANKEKTLVYAPLRGRVSLAMQDSFYNGNLLIIDHGKKIYSIYAHLYDILVEEGDIVKPGQKVARIGSTGRSTGPHLHWGVYVGHQAVDPKFLVKN